MFLFKSLSRWTKQWFGHEPERDLFFWKIDLKILLRIQLIDTKRG